MIAATGAPDGGAWASELVVGSVFTRLTVRPPARQDPDPARFDSPVRIVVIGGGVAGLAAAVRLRALAAERPVEVLIVERSPRLGGKLRTGALAGQTVETGAETFLSTEAGDASAVTALARRVGLGNDLVHPASVPAALVAGGELRPIPSGTLLGVPADPSSVDGFTFEPHDEDTGAPLLAAGTDIAVGELVARRFGSDVVRRLVDPLLGGVYAGSADHLSLAATIPALHATAQRERTLAAAVREAIAGSRRPAGSPVFTTVQGGLSRLVSALAEASGARLLLGTTVRAITRTGAGYRLTTGSTRDVVDLEADAVVVAVPGAPAARLVGGVDEAASAAIAVLDYASVALVTIALPPDTVLPELSGFLVPATEGFQVKAATFFTTKWPHVQGTDRPVLVRASLGRYGDVATLQRPDADLVGTVSRELGMILGAPLPEALAATVTRWGGALPQYGVGHFDRVAAARAALPPTLALAGAAFDGIGIAACVRSGEVAAQALWAGLKESVT